MPNVSRKAALDRIVETIVYLTTESRRLARESAAAHGLTATQVSVMKLLDAIGDLSLSSLSVRIGANNSTVTGVIDRMERDGLVQRRRSGEDRRVVYIELTSRGRKLASDAKVDPMQLFRALLEDLPSRDAAELERITTKLVARVREIISAEDVVEERA